MKSSFLSILLILSFMVSNAQSNYSSIWKEVERLEKQSLPQSALKKVDEIYLKAEKEKDAPEAIKALIYQLKYESAIDRDVVPEKIQSIEVLANNSKDKVEQSVLYYLLAQFYYLYYDSDTWAIEQRTMLTGDVPKDIREWSGNIFTKKIVDCTELSILAKKELQATDILVYKELLNEGKSSRTLRPTMYDFLMNEAITSIDQLNSGYNTTQHFKQTELTNPKYFTDYRSFTKLAITPDSKYDLGLLALTKYQELLQFRSQQADISQKESDKQALLMVDLDRLNFIQRNYHSENELYIQALENLEKEYSKYDFAVEILHEKNQFYIDSDKNQTAQVYEICQNGIKQYPNYERIGLLKNALADITLGNLEANTPNIVYPGDSLNISINYRNFKKIRIEIYRINAPVTIYSDVWNKSGKFKEYGTKVYSQEVNLEMDFPYEDYKKEIKIPANELGSYEYVIYADALKNPYANQQFSVSRLATIARSVDNGREFLVTDSKSGKPIVGASIDLYEHDLKKIIRSGKTDNWGLVYFDGENRDIAYYNATYQSDKAQTVSPVPWIYRGEKQETQSRLSLLTDRSIYRPGQTVHIKGIAYQTGKEISEVIANQTYTLTFFDANRKKITDKEFKTNEFGSFSGEFQIPQGLMSGRFTIESDNGNAYLSIRVEEYKRPTFDIRFFPNEETYHFGDSIKVKGEAKTFSGVSLQDTKIQYRITQAQHWLFRYYFRSTQIAEGTVQTQENGNFEIDFLAEKRKEDEKNNSVYYSYQIEVWATDSNGETQLESTQIPVGDKSMYLVFDNKLNQVLENIEGTKISAFNLSGSPIAVAKTYEIYRLTSEEKTVSSVGKIDWEQGELVASGSLQADEAITLPKNIKLPSGRYRIIAKAKDIRNREVEATQDFTIASPKDKRPPIPVYQWLMETKTTVSIGEKAEIIYGSTAKNVYVLYELFHEGKKISISRFELNNENKKIEIPYLASYGDGIIASFTFVKDKKVFSKEVRITPKKEDKTLKLNMETFRDRLLPGQQEEWKISVKDGKGNPVVAELLATMYDFSLDKITNHSWMFNPSTLSYLNGPNWNNSMGFRNSISSFSSRYTYIDVPSFQFDSFNWFGLNISSAMLRAYSMYNAPMMKSRGMNDEMLEEESSFDMVADVAGGIDIEDLRSHKVVVNEATQESVQEEGTDKFNEIQEVQIRQNFNETAFFYPQLKTNEQGETVIAFTVPESNTTWRFMGLAHTTDLKYGIIENYAISQKQLMVTPNIPRFMREGDTMTISTNISNLSEETLTGSVEIECFDPSTEKSTIAIANQTQSFAIESGKTTAVSWTFQIPSNLDMTALRIVAKTDTYSDGEQHLIPILPNRMLVTESMPMNIRGGESKTFNFDKLLNNNSTSLENYRLTLEFTSNPIWYAIQALPSMQTPQSDDVISWMAAFYANNIAATLVQKMPKIKQVIDVWNKQGGTKETLISNLEKNAELKAILLEETPWVLEAADETEQKQRLALLFDLNRNSHLNAQATAKLSELQNSDGGWSWFKGMKSNVSVTQWILYTMANLEQLKAIDSFENMQNIRGNTVQFTDTQMNTHFANYKKNNRWKELKYVSTYELEYLYVRGFYKNYTLSATTQEAVNFYTSVVEKHWTQDTNLYKRALMAVVMQRAGKTNIAQAMIKSLREHASQKDDLGMYWANNSTSGFMFQSATGIHTFIMEAFQEIGAKDGEMDEMKLWLLKQKQTQIWESTPATVNAVNILLQTGNDWVSEDGKVSISLGNQAINTQGEAGTGYFKETIEAAAIQSEMGKVSVKKEDAAPGWGALYWQYFEDLDKITTSKTGLNVEKSLFIEKVSDTGKILVPINSEIQVGDKITVRLTVRSDRDMEYVMLKDLRAACFEPTEQLSGMQWKQGLTYYQSPKDASMNLFFSAMPKGTYVFEYSLYATSEGDYSNGIATIQCLYAPEFVSNTSGGRVHVVTEK